MDDFVRRENLRHLRDVLNKTTDEAKRRQILKLLAEEEIAEIKTKPRARPTEH